MSTATAFLIHGYLGAGKTTLARRIEVEQAAIRLTHDEWMRSLYGDDPPETHFSEYAKRVSGVMETVWTRCVALKMNVVLDFGFWKRNERASKGGRSRSPAPGGPRRHVRWGPRWGTSFCMLTLTI